MKKIIKIVIILLIALFVLFLLIGIGYYIKPSKCDEYKPTSLSLESVRFFFSCKRCVSSGGIFGGSYCLTPTPSG